MQTNYRLLLKTGLLTILSVCYFLNSFGQVSQQDKATALQLLTSNKTSAGISNTELDNLLIAGSYIDPNSGTRYVYAQQSYLKIPVYNELRVFTFKNDRLLSRSGYSVNAIDQRVHPANGIPMSTAGSAVISAIMDRGLNTTQFASPISSKDEGRFVEFGNLGVSKQNITAQLIWYPTPDGKKLKLAWQIYIIPNNSSDYWLVRIDAVTNQSLGADNLTVYDNWNAPQSNFCKQQKPTAVDLQNMFSILPNNQEQQPLLADNVNYRVVPFPAEAPSFPNGTPTLVSNPWSAGSADATTLKWHSPAVGTDYNYTRGNNVWAYHDRTNLNTGDPLRSATSTTALPNLNFDFAPDFSQEPTVTNPPNQQFNITNLFYWNNIVHDVMYNYGFTEPAGNFQANNLGRGGLGNDPVMAEAQDGSGVNNANFTTPADGSSGRMQMYLWSSPTPDRDGDADNSIIVHEFAHGISNRLTGGPSNSSCLSNAEQMGEGWSDFYALMFTQDWANSNLNTGFTNPRGIGTYALNQPPTGPGIRTQRYCTDFNINNKVYSASLPSSPHDRGEIWCAALWDMTWNIIQQEGVINPNLYNVQNGGGNIIALKLVTEGLKLQPCSPGFIDGRDAIIQADINLYGGAHVCAIKEAFRRRGMGDGASQGSSNNLTDQIPSFIGAGGGVLTLLQNGITSTPEGQNINYSNHFVAGPCGAVSNYLITDTLPSNVSFVSATNGGTYNSSNRVVSWIVNQAAGSSMDYNFVVNINAGAYHPTSTLLNETVTSNPPALPAGWTTSSTPTSNPWVSTIAQSHSAPASLYTSNLVTANDQTLTSANNIALGANPATLSFWSYINAESGWDGGVVEISTNGGGSWADLGSKMRSGGYNGSLMSGTQNPLTGRNAFTGNSLGFFKTVVDLTSYASQNIKLRFRFGSDESVAATGWYVDDILIQDPAHVDMRSNLFNASNSRVSFADSIMNITAPVSCIPPSIASGPANATICENSNTSFTVSATGTSPLVYQWQISTTGPGGPYANLANGAVYSGTTTATLNVTNAVLSMNGNVYRCIVTGLCSPLALSAGATLTVNRNGNAGTINGISPVCLFNSPTYTIIGGDPGGTWASSNTNVATVNPSGIVFGVSPGTATITYTVTGCSGDVVASKLISVTDAVNAGTVSGPQTLCAGTMATYTTNGDNGGSWSSSNTNVATVNASSGSVMTIGAGTTDITYTVTGCLGTATASQTLTVNATPQGSLSANGPFVGSGTGMLTFTASEGSGPFTVVYNDGVANRTVSNVLSGVPFATFTNPVTTTTNYSLVSVSDANCTRNGAFTGTFATITVTGASCNGYSILGTVDVKLGDQNIVTGNIGNTGVGKKVTIGKSASVNGSIQASLITVPSSSTVSGSLTYSPANVILPPVLVNTAVVPATSFTVPDNSSATITNNYGTLTIGRNATVTVSGTIYGTVYAKVGSTVTFTASDININDLKTDAGTSSPLKYTTINFGADANVMIKNTVTIGNYNRLNETASKRVTFYLADNSTTAEQFNVASIDTRITAGIYIPVGKLNISNNGPCIMTGTMIAQYIASQKGVTWNCGNSIPLMEEPTYNDLYSSASFAVKVSPNPSRSTFRIETKTSSDANVLIRIIDQTGRVINTYNNPYAKQPVMVGENLLPGVYFAQVKQGQNVQTVKLIKLN